MSEITKDELKCAILVDGSKPRWLVANAAAIMGIALSNKIPSLTACDVVDASGNTHLGIVSQPVAILDATAEELKAVRARLFADPELAELIVTDFSDIAQNSDYYENYIEKTGETPSEEIEYDAIGIYGARNLVNRVTRNLKRLK